MKKPVEIKAEDWTIEFSDVAKEQMEADPELRAMVREVTSRIRQAIHDFQAGKYESMDEAMRASGAKPMDEDDDIPDGTIECDIGDEDDDD